MRGYISRILEISLKKRLESFPIVAILGPRQCGKSTLARHYLRAIKNSVYLDLESSSDRNKLTEPEMFFSNNRDHLICIDEIQRAPGLFADLRVEADRRNRNGQFLLLGSASQALIKQSSETLAGRISYLELTPFLYGELKAIKKDPLQILLSGCFPRSFLSAGPEESFLWRTDFIRTFLERDIPQLGIRISSDRIERLWKMCAHLHGQIVNYSMIGGSLGLNDVTIRNYIELLVNTYMVRLLKPYSANLKKRLIKSPKLYMRDTGILHALLGLAEINELLGHPVIGSSWESWIIENVLPLLRPNVEAGFFRTSKGAEIDLVLRKGRAVYGIECKFSRSPKVTRGFWTALQDIHAEKAWIVAPVDDAYPLKDIVTVASLDFLLGALKEQDLI